MNFSMDPNVLPANDYLIEYRNISTKLRKRFLRKPNVAEAAEQFEVLQRRLADNELWSGAGLCCVAAAKCYKTLGHAAAEADALVRAARLYVKAEDATQSLLCPSEGDQLQTAAACYRRAIALHDAAAERLAHEEQQLEEDDSATGHQLTAAALAVELADHEEKSGDWSESQLLLVSAADKLASCVMQQLLVLRRLIHCQLMLGDIDAALQTSARALVVLDQQRTNDKVALTGALAQHWHWFEVIGYLLMLLLQPLPTKIPEPLTRVSSKYSNSSDAPLDSEPPFSDASLLCLLQCLTMAVSDRDYENVQQLVESLSTNLHHLPDHLHLLHLIATDVSRG